MTNCDLHREAQRIVGELLRLLSEEQITRKIDGPIERAAENFEMELPEKVSHAFFHRTIARFVRHIYRHGLPCSRRLSLEQARDKAIAILSRRYRGDSARGYEAALLDATCPSHSGLGAVLTRLTENIQEKERASYINWVFLSQMDPRHHELREQVAEILLERNAPFLSDEIRGMTPAELAECWQELALFDVKTDDLLRQACDHPTGNR